MRISKKKYLQYINPLELLRTKKILQNNPTISPVSTERTSSVLTLIAYDETECTIRHDLPREEVLISLFQGDKNYWLNVDALNAETVEQIGKNIGLHQLIVEDILSKNQRPKLDELEDFFTCVLHMIYYNDQTRGVESEQVSFVLGRNFLISFQDDSIRDVFNPVRDRLKKNASRLRISEPDYLMYALIDIIVDNYFIVLDKLAIQIEKLEEDVTKGDMEKYTMNHINDLRKELMFFKRNTHPVRELISGIIRSENPMIAGTTIKYFKDIYDHIIQANDLTDTYRDVITNIRDLYLSQVNLKMNEIMKFLAIVTALLAPATVIGGIFGMNFDRIPYVHHQNGFWIATALMILVPIGMLFYFKGKNWF